MPSLYVVLERKLPNVDTYVNGNFLSKNDKELERIAKRAGVSTLMSFFSISHEEYESLAAKGKPPEEQWFDAEDGVRTVRALRENLANSKVSNPDQVESELQEFESLLEIAQANGVRWHLAVDY